MKFTETSLHWLIILLGGPLTMTNDGEEEDGGDNGRSNNIKLRTLTEEHHTVEDVNRDSDAKEERSEVDDNMLNGE